MIEKKSNTASVGKRSRLKELDNEIQKLIESYEEIDPTKIETFSDLPLSAKTKQGLAQAGFVKPSDIQRDAIILALKGHDVLGAAKTGSGKTLAFMVPLLETLYKLKWSSVDGLGALVISPTRELAFQTFEVLKAIGSFHDFSAGLVIGGKNLEHESSCINRTNIVVCTPGRLLQHMDETWSFHADNLKILVLDEADRILDLGFSKTMKAIIENIPKTRQTLLFSATQTKSVSALASLSLRNPIYVSVHERASESTPETLVQTFTFVELHEKLNFVYSFIRQHLFQKSLVFIQSCKQVKFVTNLFKKLRPGVPIMGLCGTMGQVRRMAVFENFCSKSAAVLFATDIASRGLDFPKVHWVIQMDCPPDPETYIHRVGRTARFERNGYALLLLRPEEKEMVSKIRQRKVPINEIKPNPIFLRDIGQKILAEVSESPTLVESAKLAFTSYLRSVHLMSDKDVFDPTTIDIVKFATSYGIKRPPKVRFLKKNLNPSQEMNNTPEEPVAIPETDVYDDTPETVPDLVHVDEIAEFKPARPLKALSDDVTHRFNLLAAAVSSQGRKNIKTYKTNVKEKKRAKKNKAKQIKNGFTSDASDMNDSDMRMDDSYHSDQISDDPDLIATKKRKTEENEVTSSHDSNFEEDDNDVADDDKDSDM